MQNEADIKLSTWCERKLNQIIKMNTNEDNEHISKE